MRALPYREMPGEGCLFRPENGEQLMINTALLWGMYPKIPADNITPMISWLPDYGPCKLSQAREASNIRHDSTRPI
jgi:hypothetical protein